MNSQNPIGLQVDEDRDPRADMLERRSVRVADPKRRVDDREVGRMKGLSDERVEIAGRLAIAGRGECRAGMGPGPWLHRPRVMRRRGRGDRQAQRLHGSGVRRGRQRGHWHDEDCKEQEERRIERWHRSGNNEDRMLSSLTSSKNVCKVRCCGYSLRNTLRKRSMKNIL